MVKATIYRGRELDLGRDQDLPRGDLQAVDGDGQKRRHLECKCDVLSF